MFRPRPDPALKSAIKHHQAGQLEKAESIYRQVLNRRPRDADVLHQLGIIAAQRGRPDEAEALFRRALEAKPDFPDALANLANILIGREEYEEAEEVLRKSLARRPDNPIALSNLSFAVRLLGRPEEAVEPARRSLALRPNHPDALNNLGSALEELGRFDEAMGCFGRALARAPNDATIHLNFAHALLRAGDFERGWAEYEWRWKVRGFKDAQRIFPEPRWDGSDLRGRSIFVHAEQGLGDTIQFCRFVPLLARRGGRVIFECQPPLNRLMKSLAGVDQLTAGAGERPHADVRCPLLSLPMVLGFATPQTAEIPYLHADEGRTESCASVCARTTRA